MPWQAGITIPLPYPRHQFFTSVAGEIVRGLRTLATFPEDPGLIYSISGGSQLTVTPVLRDPMPSCGLLGHQAPMPCIDTWAQGIELESLARAVWTLNH